MLATFKLVWYCLTGREGYLRELKMHLLKQLINIPFRLLDKLIKFPEKLEYPQSRMLNSAYLRMVQAYRLDKVNGTFGPKPDGNFERFLRVSAKTVLALSEFDRYYRSWLGLAFLLAQDEVDGMDSSPSTLKREIKRQWRLDIDFLDDRLLAGPLKEDFVEIALTDTMGNMARMKPEEAEAFLSHVNSEGGEKK